MPHLHKRVPSDSLAPQPSSPSTTTLSQKMSSSTQRLKLAILDDYAGIASSKFSHLSSHLEIHSFPETLNPKTPEGRNALISRLKGFQIISTMRERTPLPRDILAELVPDLKLLLTTGMRNASIDDLACKDLGVMYAGTKPAPGTPPTYSVTNEQCWALILGLAKDVAGCDLRLKATKQGWQGGSLAMGLAGKTLALVGLGRLGVQAAVSGKLGFGMEVICWSTNLTQEKADEAAENAGLAKGSFRVVARKTELFENADVLCVQLVLGERSRGIVGREELAVMKKTALLVNTSRGPLVDEEALLETLREGRIAGAALDVFDTEPLEGDSPWRRTDWGTNGRSRVLLSPHMGYVEERQMHSWYEQHAANVGKWINGEEVMNRI